MSKFLTTAALSLTMLGGIAFAQTSTATAPSGASQVKNCGPGSMADTSSDMGNAGTGASSSKIGTGTQDSGATGNGMNGQGTSGVMGTMAPAASGQGATGAVPNSCH